MAVVDFLPTSWSSFFESTSFERDRDLTVMQLNGDHSFAELPGLNFRWAMNRATTHQDEVALGMEYFYEPCGYSALLPCDSGTSPAAPPTAFPVPVDELGPGRFAAQNRLTLSANAIEEESWFYRLDADYELDLADQSRFKLLGGVWFERAGRATVSAVIRPSRMKKLSQNLT